MNQGLGKTYQKLTQLIPKVWGTSSKLQVAQYLKKALDQTHISQDLTKNLKNTSLAIYLKKIGQNVDLLAQIMFMELDLRYTAQIFVDLGFSFKNPKRKHVQENGRNESKKTHSRIYLKCRLDRLSEGLDACILNRVRPMKVRMGWECQLSELNVCKSVQTGCEGPDNLQPECPFEHSFSLGLNPKCFLSIFSTFYSI